MIKKTIAIGFMCVLLMSGLVMAQEGIGQDSNLQGLNNYPVDSNLQGLNNYPVNSNLNGLQTYAVDKEIIEETLTKSWNKLQIQDKERLQNMEQIQFKQEGNNIIAEGKVPAKFLNLFQTQATQQFRLLDNGSIERMPKWYDWMFRYEGD